jgi:ATP-binding cassette subfamily F protein 3
MLTLSGLQKSFGGRVLFDDVALSLLKGERVGLVGPNGAGKSTLLKIILGREQPDAGEVTFMRGTRLGYLPQESEPAGNETVLDIAVPHEHEHDGQFVARAKQILANLSFKQSDFLRPAREMSGGWVMRAHLARLLVQEPDLLMLDEPTNHLDLATKEMLLESLAAFDGTMIFVSHDRAFLRGLSNRVLELGGESGVDAEPHVYPGSYIDYVARTGHEATGVHA